MTEEALEAAGDTADAAQEDHGASDPAGSWGAAYASAVRLAAGFVGVVVDRAQEAANSAAESDPDEAPPVEEVPIPENVPGAVIFGFAADLPNRFGRMTSSVSDGTGLVRGMVGYGWRVTAHSPIGWLIAKPVDAVLELVDSETERLSEIGRTEVAEGKALVEAVVDTTIDGVLDNVSESDALNELIKEQAFGITDAAIQEVRETGAAADNLTDSAIRKLLRREPRELPPRPAAERE